MSAVITEFAPAKINLALHVLGRRVDGYHELDSVVAFAEVGDVLTFTFGDRTTLSVSGPFAADVPMNSDNLVLKAYAALKQHCDLPAVAMHLTKNLPVASGMGGGSADAAAALRGLMRLAEIQLPPEALQKIALSLGADVPVCLYGKACRMQGVGELITSLEQLPAPAILLVNPLQPCGTADVFRRMALKPGDMAGTGLDISNAAEWRNDMANAALNVVPVIGDVLTSLKALPNGRAIRMSGSGATCFALFDTREIADQAASRLKLLRPRWWVAAAELT